MSVLVMLLKSHYIKMIVGILIICRGEVGGLGDSL